MDVEERYLDQAIELGQKVLLDGLNEEKPWREVIKDLAQAMADIEQEIMEWAQENGVGGEE